MTSFALLDAAKRRAPVAQRCDWGLAAAHELSAELEPGDERVTASSQELARLWIESALEAHAGVAKNARLSLQLLSLAAPPQMLSAAARAMHDETHYAQACFSLARRYARHDVGPGALPLDLSGLDADATSVAIETVQTGCIGHVISALAAREALEHCEDAATREVLLRRHESKAQEAQLAWRLLAWLLRRAGPELLDAVRVTFLASLRAKDKGEPLTLHDRELLRHGVLGSRPRVVLAQRVLRDVVLPSMESLLLAQRRDSARS